MACGVYATFMPLISYRGHCRHDWTLLPTLCRQNLPTHYLRQMENEVIQQFRARFQLAEWTATEVLVHARHHGAPTRLLDWSQNPLVGLWFAICEKSHDAVDGTVYQMMPAESSLISISTDCDIVKNDPCKSGHSIHVIASPPRIDRSHRQRSVFSIATFKDDYVLKPLDEIVNQGEKKTIRKFSVPAPFKLELRRLLSDLALDAYSVYGDPDSYGKALALHFDLADLKISFEEKPQ